ncbi:MAG: ATP-binding cassette domain-containing protein [Thermoanaerobaculia bacterium]
MSEPMVAFDDVTLYSADSRPVFEAMTWNLARGARVRIDAERGEGGTALLRLCAGLAHPHRGRVLLDGVAHSPDRFDHPTLRRGAVGWIPQNGGLVANLTLLENVMLPLRFISGWTRAEAEVKALSLLGALGVGDRASQRPHAMPRRERHLAALARAAAMRVELWLWDRPLNDLETVDLSRVLDVLGDLFELPDTTILVVGNEPLCASFTSTVVVLESGRLFEEGATIS